jgi:AcrR family transcriptional regulator
MPNDKEDLIRALAKQAYRHELLVKALRARGYLGPDEPDSLWDAEGFKDFLRVFREYFLGRSRRSGESGES